MHASHMPHPVDYALQILTMMTWYMTVSKWVSLKMSAYLCTRGGIPKDSLKPNDVTTFSWHLFTKPHSDQPISLPVSQSVISSQF